jgi:hypothetical protein
MPQVGQRAERTRIVSARDIELFTEITPRTCRGRARSS